MVTWHSLGLELKKHFLSGFLIIHILRIIVQCDIVTLARKYAVSINFKNNFALVHTYHARLTRGILHCDQWFPIFMIVQVKCRKDSSTYLISVE